MIVQAYRPYGGNLDAWRARDKEVLVSGPAGTGKSRGILEKIHWLCGAYTCRWLIARQTRTSLTDTTLVTFEDKVVPFGHPALDGGSRENRHSYKYPNGSEIVLGGFDQPTRMLSSEYDGIYIPEATEVSRGGYETALTRLRNNRLPVHQMIADCNPDAPTHWLYQRFLAGTIRLIETRHEDNPLLFDQDRKEWTQAGLDYLATLDRLTGAEKERLRYGRWVQAPGAILDNWSDEYEYDDFLVPGDWKRFTFHDFGPVHAFVISAAEHPTETDAEGYPVLYCYRELFPNTATSTTEIVRELRRRDMVDFATWAAKHGKEVPVWKPRGIGGNKTGEQGWRGDYTKSGLKVEEPTEGSRDTQISRLHACVGRGGLRIARHGCPTLLGMIKTWRWKLDDGGEPIPGKIFKDEKFHGPAALRYGVSQLRPYVRDDHEQAKQAFPQGSIGQAFGGDFGDDQDHVGW